MRLSKTNFRPNSVLAILSKAFERCLYDQLYGYCHACLLACCLFNVSLPIYVGLDVVHYVFLHWYLYATRLVLCEVSVDFEASHASINIFVPALFRPTPGERPSNLETQNLFFPLMFYQALAMFKPSQSTIST